MPCMPGVGWMSPEMNLKDKPMIDRTSRLADFLAL